MGKKQELLTAAAKIIQEDGIQKLTMDYLAKKVGITKGGVLYHFESKGILLQKMNEMAIEELERKIEHHRSILTGSCRFTRAYAMATLDYLQDTGNAQLTAVFISSHEDKVGFELWKKASQTWEDKFVLDQGNPDKVLMLRLICDGIWFSIMYDYANVDEIKEQMKKIVLQNCHALNQEEM